MANEREPYLDILEDEILNPSRSPREHLKAYQDLMSRIDHYPKDSDKFPQVRDVVLGDLGDPLLNVGDEREQAEALLRLVKQNLQHRD